MLCVAEEKLSCCKIWVQFFCFCFWRWVWQWDLLFFFFFVFLFLVVICCVISFRLLPYQTPFLFFFFLVSSPLPLWSELCSFACVYREVVVVAATFWNGFGCLQAKFIHQFLWVWEVQNYSHTTKDWRFRPRAYHLLLLSGAFAGRGFAKEVNCLLKQTFSTSVLSRVWTHTRARAREERRTIAWLSRLRTRWNQIIRYVQIPCSCVCLEFWESGKQRETELGERQRVEKKRLVELVSRTEKLNECKL